MCEDRFDLFRRAVEVADREVDMADVELPLLFPLLPLRALLALPLLVGSRCVVAGSGNSDPERVLVEVDFRKDRSMSRIAGERPDIILGPVPVPVLVFDEAECEAEAEQCRFGVRGRVVEALVLDELSLLCRPCSLPSVFGLLEPLPCNPPRPPASSTTPTAAGESQ